MIAIVDKKKIIRAVSLILAMIFFASLIFQISWVQKLWYPMPYKGLIQQYSSEYEVDPFLVTAVIREESRFMPKSLSAVGAVGLMQLMPETATWAAQMIGMQGVTQESLYQPEINIRLGAWYLANLSKQFGQNQVLVLTAYNGGRGRVKRWLEGGDMSQSGNIEEIPIAETKEYVKRVQSSYEKYKKLYAE